MSTAGSPTTPAPLKTGGLYRHHQPACLMALAVVSLITGIVFGSSTRPARAISQQQQVNQFYALHLTHLAGEARQLPPPIWPDKPIAQDLNDYDSLLYSMEGECSAMESQYPAMHSWAVPRSTKDDMNQVEQLCGDLQGVLRYSQSLYQTAHTYLTLDTGNWPGASDSYDFATRLNETISQATFARQHLQNLNNSAVQDPALSELATDVGTSLQQAANAQGAFSKNDTTGADAAALQLNKQLMDVRADFLTARTYFWNNTVQVAKLQQTVDHLARAFSSN